LNTTRIASPAKRSIKPPSRSVTIGTAVAQYAFSIWTTAIGDRPSEKRVKPARSAKSAVTSAS